MDRPDPAGDPVTALRLELLRRKRLDQEPRHRWTELTSEDMAGVLRQDAENTEWAKRLLDERGWPATSEVGDDASVGFWLLVQHSPDHDFQERCVPLLEAMVARGEARPADLALLVDRTRMNRGEPQLYGSQIVGRNDDGRGKPWTIHDPDHVDERRADMGLGPLAEYLEMVGSWKPGTTIATTVPCPVCGSDLSIDLPLADSAGWKDGRAVVGGTCTQCDATSTFAFLE